MLYEAMAVGREPVSDAGDDLVDVHYGLATTNWTKLHRKVSERVLFSTMHLRADS